MLMRIAIALSVLALVVAAAAPSAQSALTDPYDILNKHYAAIGGIDKIKAQTTSYTEGRIDIVGSGLAGPFRQWSMRPEMQRMEVELGPLAITQGNNGEVAWTVDQNGKLQLHKDDLSIGQKKADSLMAEFVHLDPNNGIFTLRYDGIDTAAGKDCYVLTMFNNLTPDTSRQYFDTATFYQLKTISIATDGQTHTTMSDFRDVGGVTVPFAQRQVSMAVGMVQEIVIEKVEVGVTIDAARFDPPAEDASDLTFAEGGKAENIPFKFTENHIYIPVVVNGKERIWVLDSGAEMTCIEKKFAEELGLEIKGEITGRGAGNTVDISFTTVPPLSIGDKIFLQEQSVAVIDLYWFFMEHIGIEVAGILGYDFLSRVVTKVDYANELLSFYDPKTFTYSGSGVVLDAPVTQGHSFEVPLVVDGTMKGNYFLDLGAGGMSFHYPYAKANGLMERGGVEALGYGAGGSFKEKTLKIKTVEVAGMTVKDVLFRVPAGELQGSFAEATVDGNMGNTLFRHFVLYLDYLRGQLIWEKGGDFDRVFPEDKSGMQVRYDRDLAMRVSFVAPGTPSAAAGFEIDDMILKVNGKDAKTLDGILALRELLRADAGTNYDFEIKRGDATKKLRLVLQDLYN